jgi:hypothetical protein
MNHSREGGLSTTPAYDALRGFWEGQPEDKLMHQRTNMHRLSARVKVQGGQQGCDALITNNTRQSRLSTTLAGIWVMALWLGSWDEQRDDKLTGEPTCTTSY